MASSDQPVMSTAGELAVFVYSLEASRRPEITAFGPSCSVRVRPDGALAFVPTSSCYNQWAEDWSQEFSRLTGCQVASRGTQLWPHPELQFPKSTNRPFGELLDAAPPDSPLWFYDYTQPEPYRVQVQRGPYSPERIEIVFSEEAYETVRTNTMQALSSRLRAFLEDTSVPQRHCL